MDPHHEHGSRSAKKSGKHRRRKKNHKPVTFLTKLSEKMGLPKKQKAEHGEESSAKRPMPPSEFQSKTGPGKHKQKRRKGQADVNGKKRAAAVSFQTSREDWDPNPIWTKLQEKLGLPKKQKVQHGEESSAKRPMPPSEFQSKTGPGKHKQKRRKGQADVNGKERAAVSFQTSREDWDPNPNWTKLQEKLGLPKKRKAERAEESSAKKLKPMSQSKPESRPGKHQQKRRKGQAHVNGKERAAVSFQTSREDWDPNPNWTKLQEKLGLPKKRKAERGEESSAKRPKPSSKPTSASSDTELWFNVPGLNLLNKPPAAPLPTPAEAGTTPRLTRVLGLDCEMVGVGYGGKQSQLARVSIVNEQCQTIYDTYVRPMEKVTDFRTAVSGITPHKLRTAKPFFEVQKEVYSILKDRIIVGHALQNDFKVLFDSYPWYLIRDTSRYKPFRQLKGGQTPSLKYLAKTLLGLDIQKGEHDSAQDAAAAMRLYLLHRRNWENSIPVRARRKLPRRD